MLRIYANRQCQRCCIWLSALLCLSPGHAQPQVEASELQRHARLAYRSADFCFASAVDNCELEGYEAQFRIENDRYLAFLSLGQLQGKTDTSRLQRLKVLYAELGGGLQHVVNRYVKLQGQVSYYSAGEKEAGQTNSNSGLRTAVVATMSLSPKVRFITGVEYDASQNSSDFRDHDLRGSKPKMSFVRGSLGLRYQVQPYYSILLQGDKIIKKASARRTTEGDPGSNGSASGLAYMLGLEKAF